MLNDLVIRKLLVPSRGVAQHPDGRIAGFGVRVTASGVKSFYLAYRFKGRSRRLSLGRYPYTSLAEARARAHLAMVEMGKGRDPQADRPQARDTFSGVLDEFIDGYLKHHNRASSAAETERLLKGYFLPTWQKRKVTDIDKGDVTAILDGIMARGKISAARHAFAAVRKFFNWTTDAGYIEASPCAGLKPPAKHVSRDRVLSDDELALIWRHTENSTDTAHIVIRLLLLTAQRTGEVCGLAWDELNTADSIWTMPSNRTKNHKPHSVPLSDTAMAIIKTLPRTSSSLVFPARGKPDQPYAGYSKGKAALDVAAGLSGWTLHDLRRTAATGMARLGVSPHVVERILNHTTGTFGGVAGVYNRFQYMPEMREALERWERHVLSLAERAPSSTTV